MKVLTLNTHSWMEENPEEKMTHLAETILAEDYDVIALQEVNQLIGSEKAILNDLYCPATDHAIHEDNFALRLVEYLAVAGAEYYWTWTYSHIGYLRFHEGLALLSKEPILPKGYLVSENDDERSARRRCLLTGLTEIDGKMVQVCSCHYSWWSEEGFVTEWKATEKILQESEYPLIVMGDFNNPADTEGYRLVTEGVLDLADTFVETKHQIGEHTVSKAIDGWHNNQEKLRIDYVFASKMLTPETYQVVFDGEESPVVSDHFGVATSFE